jgi:hypothetical protein
MAWCRRAERGVIRVVIQREMLRVVPQRGDRVSVVITHHQARNVEYRRSARLAFGVLDESVHRAVVEGQLLGLILVVLIAGHLLSGPAEADRLHRIRVVRQQLRGQPVDPRGVRSGRERLAVEVGGVGICREVVVERDVLLEDHDQMLNRRRGRARGLVSRSCARRPRQHQRHHPCERDAAAVGTEERHVSWGHWLTPCTEGLERCGSYGYTVYSRCSPGALTVEGR